MFVSCRSQIFQFFCKFLTFPEFFDDQKDWGSRGREFKSRHSDQEKYRFLTILVKNRYFFLYFKLNFFENCDLWWNSGGILSGMCHGQSETKMEPIASEESVLFLLA